MDIKEVNIIGITNKPIDDNPKTTAFVFDTQQKGLCGLVYFTGAYWQVSMLGTEKIEEELKKKLRLKVAKLLPNDFSIIEDPVEHFHHIGKDMKLASEAQKSYLIKLINSCPQDLYADFCSSVINSMKFYNSVYVKKDLFLFSLKNYEEDINTLKEKMDAFLSTDHSQKDQFQFIKEFGVINEYMNDIYIHHRNSLKENNKETNISTKFKM